MIDETLAQFRARRQNINRYRSLLQISLTEFERRFVERRIAEEGAQLALSRSARFLPICRLQRQYRTLSATRR
jgi:hypothetical protein